jgi:arsenate reductase
VAAQVKLLAVAGLRGFARRAIIHTMTITIWHNPKCGTSRNALALLRECGHDPTVIEYLRTPPAPAEIARVAAAVGGAQALLRTRGTDAEARGLHTADEATILAAMAADPILINRPVVIGPRGIVLARPAERALEAA